MRAPRKPQGITPHAQFLRDVCSALDANKILPGVGYRIKESPSGTILEIPRASAAIPFYPFKLYRADSSGFVYKVRGGYVGMRSANGLFNDPLVSNSQPIGGNGETIVEIISGADGVVDHLTNDDFWSPKTEAGESVTVEEITVGNTGDFGVSVPQDAAIFTIDDDLDGDGQIWASFWAELTDGSPPTGEIKCRMFSPNAGGTGRSSTAFPDVYGDQAPGTIPDKIIIPIATVIPLNVALPYTAPNPLRVQQFVSDHQIRRIPPGVINADALGGHLGPAYWRGVWDVDDTENLSGTYFYDGEEISVTETVDSADVTSLWVHIGIDLETTRPSIGGGSGPNWRLKAGPAII